MKAVLVKWSDLVAVELEAELLKADDPELRGRIQRAIDTYWLREWEKLFAPLPPHPDPIVRAKGIYKDAGS